MCVEGQEETRSHGKKKTQHHIAMKAMSFDQLRGDTEALAAMPAMNVMSVLASDKSFMDRFYLSGYEGLCVALNHADLTRSIISSAVPMEGELLVVGGGEHCALWRAICAELRIRVSAIDASSADIIAATETLMKVNPCISHILCSSQCDTQTVKALARLAHRNGRGLIVDTSADDMDMTSIEDSGADFAISAADGESPVSVIVARRSKLVMTEGNARNASHDIYALWQQSLSSRSSDLKPMA